MEYIEHNEELVMDISFECDKCAHWVETMVYVPYPDLMAEKNKDSQVEVEAEVYCDACGHEHQVIVSNTFFSATCYFTNGSDKYINCGTPYYTKDEIQELEWIIQSNEHKEVIYKQLEIVEQLQESILVQPLLNKSMNIMMYAHIVAAIEGYLSATFIHVVLNSKKLFNRLCITDDNLKNLKFNMSDLINNNKYIEDYVSNYLNNLIFHRTEKINSLFLHVLGHNFGDLSWFGKAVSIRHDCVHRAGITKERDSVDIRNKDIQNLINNARTLISNLEKTISDLSASERPLYPITTWDF
jgi:hypothetical protein